MQNEKAATYVTLVAWILAGYALVWATAPYWTADLPARILLDILAWPMGDGRPVWDDNLKWLSSIGAGLLMALGVVLGGVVAPAVRAGDKRVARVSVMAMLAWFVVDSAGSVAAGFAANAVINVPTLLVCIAPLLFALRN
jgi:hypothetical protein